MTSIVLNIFKNLRILSLKEDMILEKLSANNSEDEFSDLFAFFIKTAYSEETDFALKASCYRISLLIEKLGLKK